MQKSNLVALMVLCGACAWGQEIGLRVLQGPLPVRTGPDSAYGVLGAIEAGQLCVGTEQQAGYWKIWFNRAQGWVHGDLVELASTDYDLVSVGTNVRTGPGTSYPKVGYAKPGSSWSLIGASSSGNWHQIFYEGTQAWYSAVNRATTQHYDAPAGAPSVVADEAVEVVVAQATIRSGAGEGFDPLGTCQAGQRYLSTETAGGWRKIWFGPGEGWVLDAEVVVTSAEFDEVVGSSLNVRAGPGLEHEVVASVPSGSKWVTSAYQSAWHQVSFAGETRWISSSRVDTHDFVAPDGGAPSFTQSSVGFMKLPASGPGFVRRCGVNDPDHAWGSPTLINGLVAAAGRWAADDPSRPRIRVGDVSLPEGGAFGAHVTHQVGTDVDIYLVRSDTLEDLTSVDDPAYSSARTRAWLDAYLRPELPQIASSGVLLSDPALFSALTTTSSSVPCPGEGCPLDASGGHLPPGPPALPYVRCHPGHHDHMHVTIGSP